MDWKLDRRESKVGVPKVAKKNKDKDDEIIKKYEDCVESKPIWQMKDWVMLIVVLLLFGAAILEKQKILGAITGILLIIVILKMAISYTKRN